MTTEQYIAPSFEPDDLGAAQRMSEWLGDYMFGGTRETGEIPLLAQKRCAELVGLDGLTRAGFDKIAIELMLLEGDEQSDVAYYICGYPDAALDILASEDAKKTVEGFRRRFMTLEAATPHAEPILAPESPRTSAQEGPPAKAAAIGRVAVPQPGPGFAPEVLSFPEWQESVPYDHTMLKPSADKDSGENWQNRALCAQTDPEAFFPEKGGSTAEAKKICTGCEVRNECLENALSNDERFGIWGGLSERERRRLKRGAA